MLHFVRENDRFIDYVHSGVSIGSQSKPFRALISASISLYIRIHLAFTRQQQLFTDNLHPPPVYCTEKLNIQNKIELRVDCEITSKYLSEATNDQTRC